MELKLFHKYVTVPAYLVYLKRSKTNLNLAVGFVKKFNFYCISYVENW